MGHVKMMGATQPFISGAISKTVNLPEQATVEEVAGLSRTPGALASRRSRSTATTARSRSRCPGSRTRPRRRRWSGSHRPRCLRASHSAGACRWIAPRSAASSRSATTRAIHVGLYEDGTPGDIIVDIAKDGTTLQGLMNSLMIAVSMGLQYGVPPEVYVSKLSHMRFEPSGMTNDEDIRIAKSIVDYIFRWFGKKFLTVDQQEEVGILSTEVKARMAANYANGGASPAAPATAESPAPGQTALFNAHDDAVECARCGGRMIRTGSCYTCRDCGTNTAAARTSRQECRGARSAASVLPKVLPKVEPRSAGKILRRRDLSRGPRPAGTLASGDVLDGGYDRRFASTRYTEVIG